MRRSLLRNKLAGAGAVFRERWGVEIVAGVGSRQAEYEAVRQAVGLTDFSFARTLVFPEEAGIDILDRLVAGNVPKIRFGRVLHTLVADGGGWLVGDCYVANNDQEWVLVCESVVPDGVLDKLLEEAGAGQAGVQDLSSSHVLLSVDGFKAWEVVKKLFGADVLGLPYLSIENCEFEGERVRLWRGGKTSEFGYLLLAPGGVGERLWEAVREGVEGAGGRVCGVDIHDDLRLEGRFFNIHREGVRVRDPLELGLQWMLDFGKGAYSGREAILGRRAGGVKRKVIGVAGGGECGELLEGAWIWHDGAEVGEVVASCYSPTLGQWLGLARFPVELAYSGLRFRLGRATGPEVRSISMPPILPKSLQVKLDEL